LSARFWSYDGDTWDTHVTAEQARNRCLRALDQYRDDAPGDGWAEEVESIMWGPIAERVVEGARQEHVPECSGEEGCSIDCPIPGSSHDYVVDFDLQPVSTLEIDSAAPIAPTS